MVQCNLDSSWMLPIPVVTALPATLLEMQKPKYHPDLVSQNLHFPKIPGGRYAYEDWEALVYGRRLKKKIHFNFARGKIYTGIKLPFPSEQCTELWDGIHWLRFAVGNTQLGIWRLLPVSKEKDVIWLISDVFPECSREILNV